MILERISSLLAGTEIGWWDILDVLLSRHHLRAAAVPPGNPRRQIVIGRPGAGGSVLGLGAASTCRPSTGCCGPSCRWRCSASSSCSRPRSGRAWRISCRTPFLGVAARRRQAETLDEIVLATTSSRPGAPAPSCDRARVGLRSYIETGIALEAFVSYDLLVSIFHHATPLHDGAVIVQGNRIAAAACFLPLTVKPAAQPYPGQPPPCGDRAHRGHGRGGGSWSRKRRARSRSSRAGGSGAGSTGPPLRRSLLELVG